MWVFGYGSLLWHTNFPYEKSVGGVVKGYVRRFWQISPDHRGTPEQPGRTVTLVPEPDVGTCWGIAYRIPDDDVKDTVLYLNHREKAGYEMRKVIFHPDDQSAEFELNVYISIGDDNPYHTGPAKNEDIAEQIMRCKGPSGTNLEYALRLAYTMHKLAPHIVDEHLFDIERRLLRLCEERGIDDECFDLVEKGELRKKILDHNR